MSRPERVALVTGAARGLGAATVHRLATAGHAVVALDWCAGEDAAAVGKPVDQAVQRWRRLDVAGAGAGVVTGGRPLWETPPDELDLQLNVHARGVWHTAAPAAPAMLAGPDPSGCRFVAVAPDARSVGLFHLPAYTAAKHAVIGIVRALAADLVVADVTAVAVPPGATATPMLTATASRYPSTDVDDVGRHQLLRRLVSPEEVAGCIAFCCSPDGAVLNGGVAHADGGFQP